MKGHNGLVVTPFLAAPKVQTMAGFREAGGFQALARMQSEPDGELLRLVKAAGLRDRDASAFPTAMKWEFLIRSDSTEKVLVVPLDTAEPGCIRDEWLLERSPHLILEGMLLTVLAIRATEVIVLVRPDRPRQVSLLQQAWDDVRREGVLVHPRLVTLAERGIEIRRSPGVYLGMEESALIQYLEGGKPCGKMRAHYPIVQGYRGRPTLTIGPETLAQLPLIVRRGTDWFTGIGTPTNPGTRLVSVSGAVKKPGVYEVPIGTRVRDILSIAGGRRSGEAIGAVAPGGIGSGIIPPSVFDVAFDHQSLSRVRCHPGNGVIFVFPEDMCIVDQVQKHLQFFLEASCGECVPCREGLRQLVEAFHALTDSRSRSAYERNSLRVSGSPPPFRQLLVDLAETIRGSSRCGLGRQAVNSFLAMLEHFPDAFDDHYVRRECEKRVCRVK